MILTKDEISEELQFNICDVTFSKKDGSTRVMKCTLIPSYIELYTKKTDRIKKSSDDNLSVWDIDNKGFRSFNVSSVTAFKVK